VVDESHEEGDVVVALGPDYDDESRLLNRTLLELGTSLAARKTVDLHVVHAWRVVGESLMLGGRVSLSHDQAKELVAESEAAARELVSAALREVPRTELATIHLMRGRPEEKIIEVVEDLEPSVVVMGTVARRGLAGMIIGNTAERLLLTLDASLMAVKPPWFESPVPRPVSAPGLGLD
jgi:nucleotide-binding universal stress UspA family protein